ncbi:hypothetical protein PHLGIDRAFT_120283 [Phlebiopsis gigantea 11061_1 CR5-6]|uniref:HNH nuclease domain-containing protein n=1 Tax=Phlebiopsis gigantea (strain 11061_1 CR5-6) TaxID=745531 RepID=A0A0C3RUX4_PHLG1|nr:hypothetical protein PHLGIDRAFT_120283 [Phlebiopsis gigantea 11061_1 CR5-6]
MEILPIRPPFDWLSPVQFAHPGLGRTFLALYRNSRAADTLGVHHQTALDACRIIASTRSRSGRVPLDDDLLTGPMYWYFLADEAAPAVYPVVNDFRAWTFPIPIPEHWSAAHVVEVRPPGLRNRPMSDLVKDDDHGVCIVTGTGCTLENAHLIPREHSAWFAYHNLQIYNTDTILSTTEDAANGVTLRADIHRCLDLGGLVFVPVCNGVVAHLLDYSYDYTPFLHSLPIRLSQRVAIEFVYARFAFNILRPLNEKLEASLWTTVPIPAPLRRAPSVQSATCSQGAPRPPSEPTVSQHPLDGE